MRLQSSDPFILHQYHTHYIQLSPLVDGEDGVYQVQNIENIGIILGTKYSIGPIFVIILISFFLIFYNPSKGLVQEARKKLVTPM